MMWDMRLDTVTKVIGIKKAPLGCFLFELIFINL